MPGHQEALEDLCDKVMCLISWGRMQKSGEEFGVKDKGARNRGLGSQKVWLMSLFPAVSINAWNVLFCDRETSHDSKKIEVPSPFTRKETDSNEDVTTNRRKRNRKEGEGAKDNGQDCTRG